MIVDLPISYAADDYGYIYSTAKINGMDYVSTFANSENKHLREIAIDHSIKVKKIVDKATDILGKPIFIYSDSIGNDNPMSWSGSLVVVSDSEVFDMHDIKFDNIEFKSFMSNTDLEIRNITFMLARLRCSNCLHSGDTVRPIVIRSTSRKVIDLITPDNIVRSAANQWQNGALPVEYREALFQFILNLNKNFVNVFPTPLRTQCGIRKVLRLNKPKVINS